MQSALEPIGYDPGIEGFVKAHRHPSGAALVMTSFELADRDWICISWVKRLAHNAIPVGADLFGIVNERTIVAAERSYDYHLALGPPAEALLDYQRQRVYDWEDRHICGNDGPMSWGGCQNFLSYVWDRVGSGPKPELIQSRRFGVAVSLGGLIHLPSDPEYWSKPVLLHELAHELKPKAAHGPSFVALYIKLVVRFLGLDGRMLRSTATEHGVRFK